MGSGESVVGAQGEGRSMVQKMKIKEELNQKSSEGT